MGVTLPLVEIMKDASSILPIPMVQPLIGAVAGFLRAANVSGTASPHIHLLNFGFQEALNNFEWMRWLSATAAEYIVRIAVMCPRELDSRWTKAIESLDG